MDVFYSSHATFSNNRSDNTGGNYNRHMGR